METNSKSNPNITCSCGNVFTKDYSLSTVISVDIGEVENVNHNSFICSKCGQRYLEPVKKDIFISNE